MTALEALRAERLSEEDMAALRVQSIKTLRKERYAAVRYEDHPPWLKEGRETWYLVESYRKWLKYSEQRPARAS